MAGTVTVLSAAGLLLFQTAVAHSQETRAYTGRCHSLFLFDRPEHRRCADTFAVLTLPDGRSGFLFTLDDHTLISFTAPKGARSGPKSSEILAIDQVNFIFHGQAEQIEAKGKCEAGDPGENWSSISCAAATAKGRVAVDFTSDGGAGTPLFGMPDGLR